MNIGVILAGGKGTRMGYTEKPKQFIDIYGKPIIIHTLETFDSHMDIDKIVVVCIKEWINDLRKMLRKFEINKVTKIIEGGESRADSSRNALQYISSICSKDDILVIHDAIRPLISHKIISDNIKGAREFGVVDTVIPTADTIIKSIDSQTIDSIPVRKELYIGQTPQSFKFGILDDAYKNASEEILSIATDDCKIALSQGYNVNLVEGDKLNIKITTMEDILILKSIIKMSKLEMV